MLCWYICIGPEKGTLGESGSARFVIGSPLKGEFSIYIEYLSDRTDTVGCIWAATGSLIAGLHRHISILADSLSSSVGAYLCDPAFLFFIKSKNLRVSYSQFSEKDKGGKSDVTGISRRTK